MLTHLTAVNDTEYCSSVTCDFTHAFHCTASVAYVSCDALAVACTGDMKALHGEV